MCMKSEPIKVRVGDKVKRKCSYRPGVPIMEGVVVYVHPQERYHVVKFSFRNGAEFCESFPGRYKILPIMD